MHPSPLNAGNTSGFRYQALLIINSITTIITTNINIHCGFSSDLRLSTLKFSNADIERWPPQYHSRRVEISQISEGNCGQLLGQELHPFVFLWNSAQTQSSRWLRILQISEEERAQMLSHRLRSMPPICKYKGVGLS